MRARLGSLTLRARLLLLGGVATAAVVVLVAVTSLLMAGIEAKTTTSSQVQNQTQVLSHAYESWLAWFTKLLRFRQSQI